MKREFLKNLNIEGLTDEIIQKIMDEHGKTITSLSAKLETANADIANWQAKYGEIETKLKAFDGVNVDELKGQIAKLTGEITAKQQEYETERAKDRRKSEITEFLSGYKFVNDRTKKSFADDLFNARDDKANEGKNYKDLLDAMTKDKDGKDLPDIFVVENPNKAGFGNPLPPSGGAPEKSNAETKRFF